MPPPLPPELDAQFEVVIVLVSRF
ncbi:MAG: hypothetical protein QOK19_1122, partial [Solirubrobacteraceae bacterium]|nr:hypothetical protein [Solirubrobacteraceae bacterium]